MTSASLLAVLGLVGMFVLVLTGHLPGEAFAAFLAGGAVVAPSALPGKK